MKRILFANGFSPSALSSLFSDCSIEHNTGKVIYLLHSYHACRSSNKLLIVDSKSINCRLIEPGALHLFLELFHAVQLCSAPCRLKIYVKLEKIPRQFACKMLSTAEMNLHSPLYSVERGASSRNCHQRAVEFCNSAAPKNCISLVDLQILSWSLRSLLIICAAIALYFLPHSRTWGWQHKNSGSDVWEGTTFMAQGSGSSGVNRNFGFPQYQQGSYGSNQGSQYGQSQDYYQVCHKWTEHWDLRRLHPEIARNCL